MIYLWRTIRVIFLISFFQVVYTRNTSIVIIIHWNISLRSNKIFFFVFLFLRLPFGNLLFIILSMRYNHFLQSWSILSFSIFIFLALLYFSHVIFFFFCCVLVAFNIVYTVFSFLIYDFFLWMSDQLIAQLSVLKGQVNFCLILAILSRSVWLWRILL